MSKKWLGIDALKATFKDLRSHPAGLFGSSAILGSPLLIGGVVLALADGPAGVATGYLFAVIGIFTANIWRPVVLINATYRIATGAEASVAQAIQGTSARQTLRFLGASALVGLVIITAVALVMIPFLGTLISAFLGSGGFNIQVIRDLGGPLLALLIFSGLVALLVGAYLSIKLGLAGPASVIEERAATALPRSWNILRGRFWDFVVMGLLILAIGFGVFIAFGVPGMILQMRDVASSPTGLNLGSGFSFSYSFTGPGEALRRVTAGGLTGVAGVVYAVGAFLMGAVLSPIQMGATANYFLMARSADADEVDDERAPLVPAKSSITGRYAPDSYLRGNREIDAPEKQQPTRKDQDPRDLSEEEGGDDG